MALPFTVQGLFTIALYQYYIHTGDKETLRKCYPQACWILEKALGREVPGTGLIREPALYPDFPGLLDQDGNDLSSFNNSVFYQAVKALEYLAKELAPEDPSARQMAERCEAIAQKTLKSFLTYFYDPEKGYFYDSVSSVDFKPRRYYPVYAILWVSHFAEDLLGDHGQEIRQAMTRLFERPHGLGMFSVEDPAYLKDGNQFGAYYPVVEGFYRNVCKLTGYREGLEHWLEGVEWSWRQFTIPEGLTYDAENELPDNPGTKQTFAAKSWLSLFYRVFVGVEVDERGVVFSPSPLREAVSVEGIQIAGKRLSVTVEGSGSKLEGTFNGAPISSFPFIVPIAELQVENRLVVRRSE